MQNTPLGMLGQCDTPPLNQASRWPPFLRHPEDRYSDEHRQNCLAWHLVNRWTDSEVNTWLDKKNKVARIEVERRLMRCKAWVWLTTADSQRIRNSLAMEQLKADAGQANARALVFLREALNELRPIYRSEQQAAGGQL